MVLTTGSKRVDRWKDCFAVDNGRMQGLHLELCLRNDVKKRGPGILIRLPYDF